MGSTKSGSHSVRVPNDNWAAADRRAKREGTNMNAMINAVIEGYAKGYINLPKQVTSYQNVVATPTSPASAPSA